MQNTKEIGWISKQSKLNHLHARPKPRYQAAARTDTRDPSREIKPRTIQTRATCPADSSCGCHPNRYARLGARLISRGTSRDADKSQSQPIFWGFCEVKGRWWTTREQKRAKRWFLMMKGSYESKPDDAYKLKSLSCFKDIRYTTIHFPVHWIFEASFHTVWSLS